jgi:hypothetical protein
MKKVLAIAVMGVFVLASCKKDYTCECCVEWDGDKTCASGTVNGKKKDVKEACEAGSSESMGIKTTCAIK